MEEEKKYPVPRGKAANKAKAKYNSKAYDQMMVNDAKPDVTPFMERIEDSNAEKKDWMARLSTTYLKSRLMEDVARGAESHLHSTEPYPGIAKGVEFGDWGQPLSKNKSETLTA